MRTTKASFTSWSEAYQVTETMRDRYISELVNKLSGKPEGSKDFSITGNMLLLGIVLKDGSVEVWDCMPLRHSWDGRPIR